MGHSQVKVTESQYFFDTLHPCCESQLLADFVQIESGDRVLEIGCGRGFIALMLAYRFPESKEIIGIDINQEEIYEALRNNAILSQIIRKRAPVEFFLFDVREDTLNNRCWDVMVSNPPFFASRHSRSSPNAERRAARQDESLPLETLFSFSRCHLQEGGRFYLVFPSNRTPEVQALSEQKGFDVLDIKPFPDIRQRSGGISLFALQARERT